MPTVVRLDSVMLGPRVLAEITSAPKILYESVALTLPVTSSVWLGSSLLMASLPSIGMRTAPSKTPALDTPEAVAVAFSISIISPTLAYAMTLHEREVVEAGSPDLARTNRRVVALDIDCKSTAQWFCAGNFSVLSYGANRFHFWPVALEGTSTR